MQPLELLELPRWGGHRLEGSVEGVAAWNSILPLEDQSNKQGRRVAVGIYFR